MNCNKPCRGEHAKIRGQGPCGGIAKVYFRGGTLEGREKGLSDGLNGGSAEERCGPDVCLEHVRMEGWRNRQLSRQKWLEEVQSNSRLDVSDLLRTDNWRDLQCLGKMSSADERRDGPGSAMISYLFFHTYCYALFSDHPFPCEHPRAAEMYGHSLVACNNRSVFSHSSGDDVWS